MARLTPAQDTAHAARLREIDAAKAQALAEVLERFGATAHPDAIAFGYGPVAESYYEARVDELLGVTR